MQVKQQTEKGSSFFLSAVLCERRRKFKKSQRKARRQKGEITGRRDDRMTKRQKGKLSGGRVRRKKNEETAREMPGECGSRKTKKRERAEIRGIKTESAWRG